MPLLLLVGNAPVIPAPVHPIRATARMTPNASTASMTAGGVLYTFGSGGGRMTVHSPALSEATLTLTLLDAAGQPIIDGTATVRIIELPTGATILPATTMAHQGAGVYASLVPAPNYPVGGWLLQTMTGKDVTGAVVATRRLEWKDNGR